MTFNGDAKWNRADTVLCIYIGVLVLKVRPEFIRCIYPPHKASKFGHLKWRLLAYAAVNLPPNGHFSSETRQVY